MRPVLGVKFDPSLAVSLGHYMHESHQHFQTYVSARGQLASWGPGPVSKQFYVSKRVTFAVSKPISKRSFETTPAVVIHPQGKLSQHNSTALIKPLQPGTIRLILERSN